jgi:transposase
VYTDMEQWRDIRRRILAEGDGKRQICREYGIHFKTLQKILEHAEPPGYRLTKPREKRKIGPYISFIEETLAADQKAPRKQRHTARRLYDRLVKEHGYDGGYTTVKEIVRAYRQKTQEVYIPLSHPRGWAQVDFGHAEIELAGERTEIAFFVLTLPFSDSFFVCAFLRECTETFQEGHKRAFEFIPVIIKSRSTSSLCFLASDWR